MKNFSFAFSFASLILSVFAVYSSLINPARDFSSNLIAVLGILCTVLVGWQIFALFDFRNYEKKLGELQSRLQETDDDIRKKYDSLKRTYSFIDQGQGILYSEVAKIYQYLMKIDPHSASEYLYHAIRCYLLDFQKELGRGVPVFLRSILHDIERCTNLGVGLTFTQAKDLECLVNSFEPSIRNANQDVKKIFADLVDLIHHLPIAPTTLPE